ncbi:MAG: hypothetical protein AMXMBFR53_16200 [Gemmatimonadota bacterium]
MADSRRGLTWRAAWLVAAVLLMVLWRLTAGKPGHVVQIEFGMDPELFTGAQVLVDGEVVGTLERLRSRTLNGFRVEEGRREVALRKDGFASEPTVVEVGGFGGGPQRLMAEVEDRWVGGEAVPVLVLR